ncbi:hypothetical protein LY632_10675 [Erythrobacter sp. SDW2]|uniref:hypothetical protein n=1 Tax=Erythrobacter sp. SDW2 TaxID=2907154 RepID=UPI001F1E585B|nr:hypothetical protein [Erythrobacter sp. SDW2]UIP06152.1 hypothetical protein LY632_10675 [Erythrobacter sp. SDW2]
MNHYQACGFAISADLPLPMMAVGQAEGTPLAMVAGTVPDRGGEVIGPFTRAGTDWIAYAVPGVAQFHVTPDTIRWQASPGVDEASIATFLLNSALPCAAMLAGVLPVRGSCVDLGESAILLTGAPAAGKSAVAAELVRRKHSLMSDGFAGVESDGTAVAGVPSLTLSRDTADALAIDLADLQPTRPGLERYHWPQALPALRKPVGGVYQLIVHTSPEVRFADIRGADRLAMLRANSFRPLEHQRFGLNPAMLQMVAALSAKARFRRVWRPVKDLPIAVLADHILADLDLAEAP